MKKKRTRGAHYTVDFFGCDPDQIDDIKFWKKILPEAAAVGGLDILYSHHHPFDPQGITGFLLLSSSHISYHTWPEYNYVACDVFSCTSGEETKRSVDFLKKQIKNSRTKIHKIDRGYVVMEYFESPKYSNGQKEYIKVDRKVYDSKSGFQHIMVMDTTKYGRCLVIDGLVQTSDFDHHVYDKIMTSKFKKTDKNILVLGGGDGFVAEEILRKKPRAKVTIVELDQVVVNVAKKFLNQKVFSKKGVTLKIGDALHFLKISADDSKQKYDGVVIDLTDNPIGSQKNKKEFVEFYKKLLPLVKENLEEGGWMSVQAGASKVKPRTYLDAVKVLSPIIQKVFGNVERKDEMIPSFSEKNAFLFAKKEG